jgi:hypothetical protein
MTALERRAAGEKQFGKGDGGGGFKQVGRQLRPEGIKRLKPGKQLAI